MLMLFIYCNKAQNLVPNPGFEIYSGTNDTGFIKVALSQNLPINMFHGSNFKLTYDWFGRYCMGWNGSRGALRNRCWDSLGFKLGKLEETLTFENAFDTAHYTHSGMSCAN